MSQAEVIRVQDEHMAQLAQFYRASWEPNATVDNVRRARNLDAATNPHGAGIDIPTFLFMHEGKPAGHLSTIPVMLWRNGKEEPAYWMKGFWVLPDYRNGPIGFLLVKEALKHIGCSMSLTVQTASRRLFSGTGFRELGVLPNCVRILDPVRVIRHVDLDALGLASLPRWLQKGLAILRSKPVSLLTGVIADWAMRGMAAILGYADRTCTIHSDIYPEATEIDQLWMSMRDAVEAAPVRDGHYLGIRYGRSAVSGEYGHVFVRRQGKLVAVAVLRLPEESSDPRLRGLHVAVLSDLLAVPQDHGAILSALGAAERLARQHHADAILCSASHQSVQRLLRRRLFLKVSSTVYFLIRNSPPTGDFGPPFDQWWVTRGDMYADQF